MDRVSFELEPKYLSKLTELANGKDVNNKAQEIVINYLNSVLPNSKPNKPIAIDRSKLGC